MSNNNFENKKKTIITIKIIIIIFNHKLKFHFMNVDFEIITTMMNI